MQPTRSQSVPHQNGATGSVADKATIFQVLKKVAVALHRLLGPQCEVVVHDFADFERSIIAIEGTITNRAVGGSATDLLLTKATSGETADDLYNYRTALPGGRQMKSCTVFLHDPNGQAFGAFCINVDVTAFAQMQQFLGVFLSGEAQPEISETFSDDIEETIQSLVAETLYELGQNLPLVGREEKIALIGRLADKGVFRVKKAVPILADQLGLSRATVYNYWREARGERAGSG